MLLFLLLTVCRSSGFRYLIFTTMKETPTASPFYYVHYNAVMSYRQLDASRVEVAIMGGMNATAQLARETNVMHFPTALAPGLPKVRDLFAAGEMLAKLLRVDAVTFVNSDIILPREFVAAVDVAMEKKTTQKMLLVGRRCKTDAYVNKKIDFTNDRWRKHLLDVAIDHGFPHSHNWVDLYSQDYFVWTPGTFGELPASLPPFVLGINGYDNWLVATAILDANTFTGDFTLVVPAMHQNHPDSPHRESFLCLLLRL